MFVKKKRTAQFGGVNFYNFFTTACHSTTWFSTTWFSTSKRNAFFYSKKNDTSSCPGLPDFSWYKIPNGHQIFPIAVK
jgi:hypothetical protein